MLRRGAGSPRRCDCGCRSSPRRESRRRPAIALELEFFVGRPLELAGALLDGARDVVGGHVGALGLVDRRAQAGVRVWSPPPRRAAIVISRISLVKSLPRLASSAPFLCLIVSTWNVRTSSFPAWSRPRTARGLHGSLASAGGSGSPQKRIAPVQSDRGFGDRIYEESPGNVLLSHRFALQYHRRWRA